MNLREIINKNNGLLPIRVTPNASHNRIELPDQITDPVRIYLTTTPENGKANKDAIKLLAKELKIAKSSLCLIKGEKSRFKTISVDLA